jgi:hypothetical protein
MNSLSSKRLETYAIQGETCQIVHMKRSTKSSVIKQQMGCRERDKTQKKIMPVDSCIGEQLLPYGGADVLVS